METASERAAPTLTCEELAEEGATLYVHNELVLHGWAESDAGRPQVEVELEGSPLPLVSGDDAGSPRLRFEARAKTSGWSPGARTITVTARDGRGGEAVRHGVVDVLPYAVPPGAVEAMQAEVAAGRLVMYCDEPRLDGSDTAVGHLAVNGWAYARPGVRAVYVTVDGRQRTEAVLGRRRPDLPRVLGATDSAFGGFGAVVDLHSLAAGAHHVSVVAVGADGSAVGREGTFLVEHGEERPVSRPVDEEGRPLAGERFVPEEYRGQLIDAEHQARYRWARPAAENAEVLDAGCGVGYGCAILAAGGARRVVGLDRSPEAILNARERAGDVAEFVLGDLGQLPFEDDAFDLVTCFEAIEHVVDPERTLDELRRVLRPEGVLLISSPNRELFTPGNPFHVHEYTPDELQGALERRFASVRLFRQQAHLATLLADDATFAVADAERQLDAEVRKTSAAPEGELYSVAVAGDGQLPVLGNIAVLADIFDIRTLFETAWAWEERAISAGADAEASRTEARLADMARERAHELLEESERARQEAEYWLVDLKASASWRVTAPLRRAKALAEAGRFGPLDAPARAVGWRLRSRLRR
jgi:SAM-dependent methyltransferase